MADINGKMREEFEAWAGGFPVFADLERGNHGSYVSQRAHELYCSWVASWQSSRATLVIELPNQHDEKYREYFDGVEGGCFDQGKYLGDVKVAIEAAGVRVLT